MPPFIDPSRNTPSPRWTAGRCESRLISSVVPCLPKACRERCTRLAVSERSRRLLPALLCSALAGSPDLGAALVLHWLHRCCSRADVLRMMALKMKPAMKPEMKPEKIARETQ